MECLKTLEKVEVDSNFTGILKKNSENSESRDPKDSAHAHHLVLFHFVLMLEENCVSRKLLLEVVIANNGYRKKPHMKLCIQIYISSTRLILSKELLCHYFYRIFT